MEDIKLTIAKNISELRRAREMTQFELAEILAYSDKAVSKWERGESVPDISVLKQIADIFSVTVDYLITEHEEEKAPDVRGVGEYIMRNHGFIMGMSILLVWLIAAVVIIVGDLVVIEEMKPLIIIYSIPISIIVWLVFNSIWFNPRLNFLIISLLMWSVLFAVYATVFIFANYNFTMLFLIALPGQAIIILWSRIKKTKK